jgi:hypothetical protein
VQRKRRPSCSGSGCVERATRAVSLAPMRLATARLQLVCLMDRASRLPAPTRPELSDPCPEGPESSSQRPKDGPRPS